MYIIPEQILWPVACDNGYRHVLDVAAGERGRVDGERERVGAVTELPIALVARTKRSPLPVLGGLGPFTHYS